MDKFRTIIFSLICLISIQTVLADERDFFSDAEKAMKEYRYSDAIQLYSAAIVFQNIDAAGKIEECRKQLLQKKISNECQINESKGKDSDGVSLPIDNLSLMAEEIDKVYNGDIELSRPCLVSSYDNNGVYIYFPVGYTNINDVCRDELLNIVTNYSDVFSVSLSLRGMPSRIGSMKDERNRIGYERLNNIISFLRSNGFIASHLKKLFNDNEALSETSLPQSIDGIIYIDFSIDEEFGHNTNDNMYLSKIKIPLYQKTIDIDYLHLTGSEYDDIIKTLKGVNCEGKTYCLQIRQNHGLKVNDELKKRWIMLMLNYMQAFIISDIPESNIQTEGIADNLSEDVLADIIISERPDITTITVNNVPIYMKSISGGKFQGRVPELGIDCQRETATSRKLYDLSVNDYKLSQFEVSQGLWEAVMGEPFKHHIDRMVTENPEMAKENPYQYGFDPLYPVYYISKNDALKFIARLNELTGKTFRLPTANEWIYAEAGGRANEYLYSDEFKRTNSKTTKKVDSGPNIIEIYGMFGNVREWTSSHPYGTAFNDKVVLHQNCFRMFPESRQFNIGIRLAMD